MIEDRMTCFEFRQKQAYARLKPIEIFGEQLSRSAIDALGPSTIINSGDIDVFVENQLLYGLQNLIALFRILRHFIFSLSFSDVGRPSAPSIVKPAHSYGSVFRPNMRNMSRLAAVRADAGDSLLERCA